MTHSLAELLEGMRSPDPAVRDGWAYAELAEGIESGRFADETDAIRQAAIGQLDSPEVQARTFAPLILTWLLGAGDTDRPAWDAAAHWYAAEADTRGYDERLGWLHAIAHGADYLGESVRAGVATGHEVLDVLAHRMVRPDDVWRDQEEARVAAAALLALGRCPDATLATAWLGVVEAALTEWEDRLASGGAEPRPPGWLRNVSATLSILYVALSEQPRDGADDLDVPADGAVRAALGATLSRMTPWLFSAQGSTGTAR